MESNNNINSGYWMSRRTIRKYSSRTVDSAVLNELLLKASHAPTTGNMQLYSVIVTTDAQERKNLAPMHFNQPQVESAPVVLTICADLNRMTRWCQCREAEPCFDNLQSLVSAIIDASAFAQQFNTLAELEGLGCCWLGTTAYNAPQIAEALELPPLVMPLITLTVGYPDEDGVEVGRLPLEAIVHHGKYIDYTPKAIDSLYAEKEARADSKAFIEENGKSTLAQVFAEVRYPRQNNEHFSQVLLDFLNECGFLKR